VVNDSLILVDAANHNRWAGKSHLESIFEASCRRFRPIVLTSLTTFLGLAPMIFETSLQARILIPMAISLGFGILFATALALVDIRKLLGFESEGVAADFMPATT
jgi:multidrug efflux pump subunit AcrB